LVGLGDVEVLGVEDETGEPLRVHIRRRAPRPGCGGCGGPLWSHGERTVDLVDLRAFGRPARLVQQASLALRRRRLLGGHRHRAGPGDRFRAREAHHKGGALGDAPVRAGLARQQHRRGTGLQLASGERVGETLPSRDRGLLRAASYAPRTLPPQPPDSENDANYNLRRITRRLYVDRQDVDRGRNRGYVV